MTTPRIEEIVEKVAEKMGFRTEASFHTKTIREALTEAHQAGIRDAMEKIKNIEIIAPDPEDKKMTWYNKGVEEAKKALSDLIKE